MNSPQPVNPELVELYKDFANIPSVLWDDLAAFKAGDVCDRAGVIYKESCGYQVFFLGGDCFVDPNRRTITVPHGGIKPGFQVGLVLLNYLIHASVQGLAGRMVTARELEGGALFFQGPHALSTRPVLKKFGQAGDEMVKRALNWGASALDFGDASFRLWVLPKILVGYTLYEQDDEFEAQLTITFDANTDKHLPLDSIWALINVVSAALGA